MDINVNVTIELSTELKDFLTQLATGWTNLTPKEKLDTYPNLEIPTLDQGIQVMEIIQDEIKKQDPVITIGELQALAIAKVKEHGQAGRDRLKEALETLKADKVSTIRPSQFQQAKELLEAING